MGGKVGRVNVGASDAFLLADLWVPLVEVLFCLLFLFLLLLGVICFCFLDMVFFGALAAIFARIFMTTEVTRSLAVVATHWAFFFLGLEDVSFEGDKREMMMDWPFFLGFSFGC